MARIDAATKTVAAIWQLSSCPGPSGLAMDAAHHQLFTGCENHKLVAINADNGHVAMIGDAAVGAGDIDFDAHRSLLFVADASGALTIFHRDSPVRYSVVQRLKTEPGARTMVLSPLSGNAYLATSKFGMNTATASEELQFRPTPVPDTFSIIVVGH
jgi:hypothetical protein